MWFDWKPTPSGDLQSLRDLCPENQFRVIEPRSLPPNILSPSLLAKTHSILMMSSGNALDGRLYLMLNLNRIDGAEIDQMPYGIAFDGNQPIQSGVLVQHGDYDANRTTPLPMGFVEFVAKSGLYPLQEMPASLSGDIADLQIGSQTSAFNLLVEQIDTGLPPGEGA